MKLSTFSLKALSIAFLTTTALLLSSCQSEKQTVRFGSGNKGGLYDKFANSFAETFNKANGSIQIQVKNTSGTSANIRLIEEGFIDFGIVQADILKDYLMRSRMRHAIAAVAGLYTESIQIVVAGDSEIKSVADLVGKRVAVGEEESGVLRNAEIILESYGISLDKVDAQKLSFKESADALKAGEIDAFFCTAGIPTPSISELANSKNIRLLSIGEADAARIMGLHPELTSSTIPAGTYAGQESDLQTLGAKAVLVTNQLVDSAVVAKVAESVFAIAAANIASASTANSIAVATALEHATANIPVAFHPGAAAFYANKNKKVEVVEPLQAREPIPSTGD